jgi:hypothetical protein
VFRAAAARCGAAERRCGAAERRGGAAERRGGAAERRGGAAERRAGGGARCAQSCVGLEPARQAQMLREALRGVLGLGDRDGAEARAGLRGAGCAEGGSGGSPGGGGCMGVRPAACAVLPSVLPPPPPPPPPLLLGAWRVCRGGVRCGRRPAVPARPRAGVRDGQRGRRGHAPGGTTPPTLRRLTNNTRGRWRPLETASRPHRVLATLRILVQLDACRRCRGGAAVNRRPRAGSGGGMGSCSWDWSGD